MHVDNKKVIEKITNLPTIATVEKNYAELKVDIKKLSALYD